MSTYLNPEKGHNFNISSLDAPGFLKEYLNYLIAVRNLAPRTVLDYFVQLKPFLRWIKTRGEDISKEEFLTVGIGDVKFDAIAELTAPDLYEYLSFSGAVLGNSSAAKALKLSAVKGLYGYYSTSVKRLTENPAAGISAPKREKKLPVYLTLDESKKLLSSVSGDTCCRDLCMLTLLLNCGMRLSELVRINVEDIRDDHSLKLRGKGRKERIIYLNAACVSSIENCLAEREKLRKIADKDALWISERTGERLSARRIEQIVEGVLSKAGLRGKGYSPHKLRHTAATLMYRSGSADLLELKEILGHESTSTTEIYTHLGEAQLRAAAENSPLADFIPESSRQPTGS